MITRLIAAEVGRGWRLWVATFLVMVATALIALVCAGDVSTAATLVDPVDAQGLRNHALVFGALNSPVVIGALNVLVTFAIRIQRRNYALWQFAGIGPSLIRRIVLAQVGALAVLAFAVALAVTPLVLDALMNALSAPLRDVHVPRLHATSGALETLAAFGVFVVVVVGSAIAAAHAASRVPALLAVREPEAEPQRAGRGRVVVTWVLGAVAIGLYSLALAGVQVGFEQLFLVMAIGAIIAIAPRLTPLALGLWTGLIPRTAGASWFIARESAVYQAVRSHAAVTLLAVSTLLGSITGYAGVWDSPDSFKLGLAVFGTPIAVVLFTGAATVVMTTLGRRRDTALLVVAGGTFRRAIGVALLEAGIVVVTAALIAIVPAALTVPVALGAWYDPLLPLPFVAVLGFVIMSLATITPVLQARRGPLGAHLVDAAA